MTVREQRIKAGMKVIDEWVKADPRGYIKADDHEVVARIMDAADEVVREQMEELLTLAKVQREDQPEGDMRDAPFDYGQRMWYGGRVTGICEALLLINEEAQQ